MKKQAQGTFIVEFAIIASLLLILLFGVIELSRLIWIWNTASLATQRGARVAAVCPIDHPAVFQATVFAAPDPTEYAKSPILRGLDTNAISVEYLGEDGEPESNFSLIKYVRVWLNKPTDPGKIQEIDKYKVTPLIPFLSTEITVPAFETTIPSESLGLKPDPDNLSLVLCSCFDNDAPSCQP